MNSFYRITRGESSNPTVILIHGLLGSSRNLMRLQENISKNGFYTVAYDQRGHGHSPHFPKTDYTLNFLVKDLLNLIESLNTNEVHLVGHSLGGRVSLLTTAMHSEKIKSLSMLDVGIHLNQEAKNDLHKIIDPLPDYFQTKEEAENFLDQHIHFSGKQKIMFEQFLMSNLRSKNDRFEWIFDLNGVRTSLLPSLAEDNTVFWKKITKPTLVLRGSESKHFLESELINMHESNPHFKSQTIPNAGHWLHVDNLTETSDAILNFLNQRSF